MSPILSHKKHRQPELVSGSIGRPALPKRRQTQPNSKVRPNRITLVDQIDLPRPMPILQLFLAQYGPLHVAKHLKMDKAVNRIFRGMAGHRPAAVLPDADEKIGRHTDVERSVKLARKDIYARVFLVSHQRSITAKWTLKQVQGDEFFALCVSPQFQRQKPRCTPQRQPYKPRHPELVSGSIGRLAPADMRMQISPEEFLRAAK